MQEAGAAGAEIKPQIPAPRAAQGSALGMGTEHLSARGDPDRSKFTCSKKTQKSNDFVLERTIKITQCHPKGHLPLS